MDGADPAGPRSSGASEQGAAERGQEERDQSADRALEEHARERSVPHRSVEQARESGNQRWEGRGGTGLGTHIEREAGAAGQVPRDVVGDRRFAAGREAGEGVPRRRHSEHHRDHDHGHPRGRPTRQGRARGTAVAFGALHGAKSSRLLRNPITALAGYPREAWVAPLAATYRADTTRSSLPRTDPLFAGTLVLGLFSSLLARVPTWCTRSASSQGGGTANADRLRASCNLQSRPEGRTTRSPGEGSARRGCRALPAPPPRQKVC